MPFCPDRSSRLGMALAASTLLLTCGLAAGAERASAPVAEMITVPTSHGLEHFKVLREKGDGRLVCEPVNEHGELMDRKKYAADPGEDEKALIEVCPCVVVHCDNVDKLYELLGDGFTIESALFHDEYWLVEARTVKKAIEVTEVLRSARIGDAAFVASARALTLKSECVDGDPLFGDQWHLSNPYVTGADIRAEQAWALGYTGEGVTVGIVDGGFVVDHPDLADNYVEDGSLGQFGASFHATGVAGLVAAARNCIGIMGVAYDSKLTSLNYGGTDYESALALFWGNDTNDIKVNSWGPHDNGRVTTLSEIERISMREGVRTGRQGLGEIYVWAAGNGGQYDRVDYDPYASARETISVGWIGHEDVRAAGNEQGACLLTVAQGGGNGVGLTTTSVIGDGYMDWFEGSSAAAPVAAGAIALMLEANPMLSWRDVQHILVHSARMNDPFDDSWDINGAGHDISYEYGFGAVDAAAAVTLAKDWRPVAPEQVFDYDVTADIAIPDNDPAGVRSTAVVTDDIRLEHIELRLDLDHEYRGDLVILLTSPTGSISKFTSPRNDPGEDYDGVIFTTVRHWDESPVGEWRLRVTDRASGDVGVLNSWSMRLFGVEPQSPCVADSNFDGVVNFDDLNMVLDNFASPHITPGFSGDVDRDGDVDIDDLNLLLERWEQSCD